MDTERLAALLRDVQNGQVSVDAALSALRTLPYDSVSDSVAEFARLDTHRAVRTGQPEVVYCPGKSPSQVAQIMQRLAAHAPRVLATRAAPEQYAAVRGLLPQAVLPRTAPTHHRR